MPLHKDYWTCPQCKAQVPNEAMHVCVKPNEPFHCILSSGGSDRTVCGIKDLEPIDFKSLELMQYDDVFKILVDKINLQTELIKELILKKVR